MHVDLSFQTKKLKSLAWRLSFKIKYTQPNFSWNVNVQIATVQCSVVWWSKMVQGRHVTLEKGAAGKSKQLVGMSLSGGGLICPPPDLE